MTYIAILLVVLKSHPVLSIWGCILFGIISQFAFPKKARFHLSKFSIIFFVIIIANIFVGHFLTNIIIDNFGEKGEAMILDNSPTSDQYNNERVYRYNVMIKPDNDSNAISTYFLSSDFNIVHNDSLNRYYYPSTGVKFNVKYIKAYPKAFVIIANDDSEYGRQLQINKYSSEKSKIENQLKMDPENPDLKEKLKELDHKIQSIIDSNSSNTSEHAKKLQLNNYLSEKSNIEDQLKLDSENSTLKKKLEELNIKILSINNSNFSGELVAIFGGKGTDSGKLNDARYITVDSDNNVWIADYTDGRIQQFNNSGEFIKMIQINGDRNDSKLIEGLAADMNGNLYVSSGSTIQKYKTADGSLSATFKGNDYYGPLAVDKDNNIYLLTSSATENTLFKLNSDGAVLARFNKIIKKANKDDPGMNADFALDSSGNIYIFSEYSKKIHVYNSNGDFIKYLDLKLNNQDTNIETISIDNSDNLYVKSFNGNYKFDLNGNLLNVLPDKNYYSTDVDSNGNIYMSDNDDIFEYNLNNPTQK
ncbi:SMP-30/gluconolaconase/LRE-like region [Clostridium beijerinckii]|uniref:NHL repeat-containing protein n=1 Tax=Clostridium beijerinckii TaxID=1520 RepID=UPI00098C6CC3|nr:NHL repeat-containing protein [Clostridium beijerinckii]OOM57625.1 SMP-30/gluconolaconase/LRE-like region [Clostridium beijerinckii]